ncbi:MAG: class I SAM-dependent methyltransferase [Ferruginibacter sp.]
MIENIPLQSQIEQLINLVVDQCPICGHHHISDMETVYWKSVKISYSICDQCSMVFQNPRMDEHNTGLYYEKYYRLFNDGIDVPTAWQLGYQQGRASYFERRLKPYIQDLKKGSNYLDIGSSGGIMLDMITAKHPGQFNIYGIEPGNAYRDYTLSKGFKVYDSLPALVANSGGKFELITMSHVLEHMMDPVEYLKEIRDKVISDTGLMMIEVPNYFGHYSYELSHNFCFSKNTLTNAIHLAGFETVSLITHAYPNISIKPLYLNILIKPADKSAPLVKSRPSGVRFKRALAPTDNSKLSSFFYNYTKRLLVKLGYFKKRLHA